ncbi:Hypothetical predicted protein, partial [Scomber scombrus]
SILSEKTKGEWLLLEEEEEEEEEEVEVEEEEEEAPVGAGSQNHQPCLTGLNLPLIPASSVKETLRTLTKQKQETLGKKKTFLKT